MSFPATQRRISRLAREERGTSTVEFALVLPVLCLVLFGILQFGITFYNYIDLTSAARDGARQVSVVRDGATAQQVATDAVNESLTSGNKDTTTTVTADSAWKSGTKVHVKVSRPWTVNIMGISFYKGPMTADSVARVE